MRFANQLFGILSMNKLFRITDIKPFTINIFQIENSYSLSCTKERINNNFSHNKLRNKLGILPLH